MKIKDVEKEVGISSKNIRFYEEEGLIQVCRDRNNAYRNFTEDDVKKLKEIKLLRGLDISLEDIRKYMRHTMTLQEVMEHRLKELDEKSD